MKASRKALSLEIHLIHSTFTPAESGKVNRQQVRFSPKKIPDRFVAMEALKRTQEHTVGRLDSRLDAMRID